MKFKIGDNRKKKIHQFGSVFEEIIKELNINEKLIIEQIKKKWPDLVGQIISSHSVPDRIFKKTLFVNVDHSVYSNELNFMKDLLISAINNEIKKELIFNIRTKIVKL